ncbi:hypothetical protein OOZ63_06310 [Paucibacter sp. PLA-PC-4]|uniref:hypothetical protein n=1 Tax=Paucibacter sp. PLA-PC-4 TaxID=2993655 RepID=UPI002248F7EA|nr:hypothetical protein [Paucibacter sp. PLA-PC-4]MCX2861449.1 hypothetical protein [Paucibacter sp. PLA-PC-4]
MRRLLPLHWLRALIWGLALALPLQAMAATLMLGCGDHGGRHATESSTHHPTQQHEHGADIEHVHHTEDMPTGHQCSACAACCLGAALPTAMPVVANPAGHGVHIARAEAARLSIIMAGLERPPRPVLA